MSTNWGMWFVEKISGMEERLGYILEMSQVRELWLQGELYLASTDDQNLNLNVSGVIKNGAVDFIGDSPKMIAELKICGRGYYNKMLTGYSLSNELALKKEFTFEDMENHNPAEGSIFKDFCRLQSADDSYEKYMVVVIPKLYLDDPDALGEILETAKFPGNENSCNLEAFNVRVFRLPS